MSDIMNQLSRQARQTFAMMVLCALAVLATSPVLAQDTPEAEATATVQATVNINTADADALSLALDGVGMTRALDIIAYREQHGDFQQIEDLERVRGIGRATLERNRHKIRLNDDGE